MNRIFSEFLRYLIVGGLAFIADFSTLVFLTEKAGLHYLLSATIGFFIGTTLNYLLSTHWVFSVRSVSNRRKEFTLFAAIGVAGVALNAGIIAFQVELIGIPYSLAKLVATSMILFFNFGARKWLLFSPSSTAPAASPPINHTGA
ncbi:MAG: polysaccharide synthesis protein GtrA [Burkholderiaceae bacterium]|nr:polysaccharide synthesis protein GtrA [Burkholderiaceae bacterium]